MIYPAIILGVIIAVIVLMMFVLVPSMAEIYGDFGADLPWTTQFLMDMSAFLIRIIGGQFLVVILVLVILVSRYYLSTKKGQRNWDKLVLKIPIVGTITSKMQLAQFTRVSVIACLLVVYLF